MEIISEIRVMPVKLQLQFTDITQISVDFKMV